MSLRWLPNAICIVRIALVAPIIALLLAERFDQALALIVLAGLSDGLDGYLA
jgi:cardiolipin synthase